MTATAAVAQPARARWPRHWAKPWQAWWDARHPLSDTLVLTQRNVYILPTRAGWVFAATLLVLLVASINYQLSLGYLLTFLLAGSAIVSMHVTHANLRGLHLHLRPSAPVFAGESWAVECVLASAGPRERNARHGIGLHWHGQAASVVWTDVAAGGQASITLALAAERRGRHALPAVTLETRFPLGLFRAWAEWRPASRLLAYPRPERPAAALPPSQPVAGPSGPRRDDGLEPEGVRAYRRGDAPQRILWKKAARTQDGGDLVVRDTAGAGRRELWLDAAHTGLIGSEARLSRLAAWVLESERRGLAWGLRLPGVEMAPGQGEPQQRAGLEALALWSA